MGIMRPCIGPMELQLRTKRMVARTIINSIRMTDGLKISGISFSIYFRIGFLETVPETHHLSVNESADPS
jgi:hypothetical protein